MTKKHAVGMVVQDRWDLTHKALQSIYLTDQAKNSYDLYLIDNGSSPAVASELKMWIEAGLMPVKNLIRSSRLPIGPAWNLFLDVARDYPYRTKLDNDLIFANTPVPVQKENVQKKDHRTPSPADAGTNPGATPVASFVIGAGKKVIREGMKRHTCFLQYVEEAISKSKLEICALAPVPIGVPMSQAMPGLSQIKWRNQPCLSGACMTITKRCFDTLGYFDDTLPCYIDKEYSQRAMATGLNIGYAEDYCVIHIGADNPTMSPAQAQQNQWQADRIAEGLPFQRPYVHSAWEKVHDKVLKAAAANRIVNLR